METRKLQLTGGSSLILTLPKKWINHFKLCNKDSVCIDYHQSGALMVQPISLKNEILQSSLNIDEHTEKTLNRELVAHYLLGADEIVIHGKQISSTQRNSIRKICQSLLGLEIIDENSKEIIIKNIFDTQKLSIPQNIERMFFITKAMFQDALKSVLDNDLTLAKDVEDRDSEIDKLQLVVTRQHQSLLRGKKSEEELGLMGSELYFYENIALQLERIADHAVKIAKLKINKKVPLDKSYIPKSFEKNINEVFEIFDQCIDMVKNFDKKIAHEVLDQIEKIENLSYSLKNKQKESKRMIIIHDSLDRLLGYVTNISEITIDQCISQQMHQKYSK